MIEEWRGVDGFPGYEVSNLGRVKSLARISTFISNRPCGPVHINRRVRERILRAGFSEGNYPQVVLCRDGGVFNRTVHTLVCRAFHGPPPSDRHEVAHRNGKRTNACADNVRWATRAANAADKRGHGTSRSGEQIPWSRLTRGQIPGIRTRLALGETCASIARDLNVSSGAIYGIKIGRNWKDA